MNDWVLLSRLDSGHGMRLIGKGDSIRKIEFDHHLGEIGWTFVKYLDSNGRRSTNSQFGWMG